jgi:hypothetical protein
MLELPVMPTGCSIVLVTNVLPVLLHAQPPKRVLLQVNCCTAFNMANMLLMLLPDAVHAALLLLEVLVCAKAVAAHILAHELSHQTSKYLALDTYHPARIRTPHLPPLHQTCVGVAAMARTLALAVKR